MKSSISLIKFHESNFHPTNSVPFRLRQLTADESTIDFETFVNCNQFTSDFNADMDPYSACGRINQADIHNYTILLLLHSTKPTTLFSPDPLLHFETTYSGLVS